MNWFDVLKLKDDDGNLLIVEDVDEFVRYLRESLRAVAAPFYGTITQSTSEGNPRKSNIVVKETWVDDNTLKVVASVRNPNTTQREYFEIILRENEEGDFYFDKVEGAGVFLFRNTNVSNSGKLIQEIQQAVKRYLQSS